MSSKKVLSRLLKPWFQQPSRIRRKLLVVVSAVLLFAATCILAAFLAVPWGVDRALARYAAAGPQRNADVESVRFNPLTLEAELQMLRLQDDSAQSTFSASVVTLKLNLQSLLKRRLQFKSILIESPNLEFRSLAQALDLGESLIDEWLSAISIKQLTVTDGRFTTTTENTGLPLQLSDIYVGLTDFDGRTERPTAATGQLRLRATTTSGAEINSDGIAGITGTTGHLTLTGFDLESLHPSLRRWLPATTLSGALDLNGDYSLTGPSSAPILELIDGTAQIRDFVLVPAAGLTARADEMNATANLVFTALDGAVAASGRIEITDAQPALSSARVTPPQTLEFAAAAILLFVDPSTYDLFIDLGGELVDAGDAMLMARIPIETPAERTLSFAAADLPAAMLSSYATQALGRGLSSGRADIKLDYLLNGQRVSGALQLLGRELAFAPPAASGQATEFDTSLDLAAALLVNADGVIDLNIPFAGNVGNAAADALRARLATLAATPFDAVASMLAGDVDAVRTVPFVPGDAALGDLALATIDQLADVLNARPRLGLRVHSGYDASADRNELARQQIQLHVLLATAGPSLQARPQPVDFNAARAQDVLDEFARERLPAARVDEIAALFNCESAIASLCRRAYYAALFNALVASEEITDGALNRLGRFRAQSIVEALTQRGINSARIEVVTGVETIDNPFGIGLPIELTVAALNRGE